MTVSTVAEMRAMDEAAIQRYGIAEELLMENAGLAAFRVLAKKTDVHRARTVVVCGGGNNGGDGLVVARHIASAGGDVRVVLMSDPERYRGAARLNYDMVCALGVDVRSAQEIGDADDPIGEASVVVDALLGTGIERPVSGAYAEMIGQIDSSGAQVLSIDIPSGVNGDTGQVMGTAVRADWTVTFGLPKVGNVLLPGWELCGELFVSHISFPPALYDADEVRVEINAPSPLPPREPAGHKGTFGQALFIAGASNYYGAPYLSAMSYLKAGGGYARLAAPASIVPTLATLGCEIVFVPQEETPSGSIAMSNLPSLLKLIERMDFVVIGPGLSLEEETQRLVREAATAIDKPLLIDGDGISAVQADLDCVRRRTAPTVLTPHLGELARLTGPSLRSRTGPSLRSRTGPSLRSRTGPSLRSRTGPSLRSRTGLSVAEIENDRVAVLRGLCGDLGATVVMKGAHTLVGEASGSVSVNMTGNSGMATAGSGDVLTGAIAAMLGLGLPFDEAVRAGVYVHGLAGDLAAAEIGEDGMTATDTLAYVPAAVRLLREGGDSPAPARYAGAVVV